MHLATTSSGQFRVCCHALPKIGLIRGEQGQALRADVDSLETVWNAPTYRTIRQQMLRGEEPEMCRRCFREERAGVTSFRQSMNSRHLEHIDPTVDADGRAAVNVRYVDLRLGNLCNLRCRMCNPYASSQWVKEWNLVSDTPLTDTETKWLSSMSWPENPKVWELMGAILESVDEIYLTGGEPTLIKQQVPLLEECVRRGLADKITLKYNTNLTYVPEKLLSLWSQFRMVRMNCSIDGVGVLNEYIRHPSVWTEIDANLRKMVGYSKDYRFNIQIHTTVQAYNLLELTDLFGYLKEFGFFPYLNILDRPAYLNARVLPRDLKDEAVDRLAPYLEQPKVKGLIQYLEEDWTHLLPEFRSYTQELDQSRQQSLAETAPILAPALAPAPGATSPRPSGAIYPSA